MNHKDLRLMLESMLRFAEQRQRNGGSVLPFAAMLTREGNVAQLTSPGRKTQPSAQESIRVLEGGLHTLTRMGRCKAVGICFDTRSNSAPEQTSREGIHILLEHQDGSAYQVVLPYVENKPAHFVYRDSIAKASQPRFFVIAQ